VNLKWATREEMLQHQHTSPKVQKARIQSGKRIAEYSKNNITGNKLTISQVIHVKKLLADPKRKTRLKIIAKKFDISEMQLFRIKKGENWGHIKIDEQDIFVTTALTQKSKKEPTKRKSGETWDEKFEAYRNGEKSGLITRWIAQNRRHYKNGNLSKEKCEKLTAINFTFEAALKEKRTNSWDRQLEEWKNGNRKSVQIQQWKQRSIRRFVEGKLSRDRTVKLKEVGILK
jgi:hypothetical protein